MSGNMARGQVTAVLGPTNTGKTHYAIERMLAYRTGVIGLPLRLLAREVYDKIVAVRGPSVVALVTGEERIVPDRVQYWVCTVEAMPVDIGADFVAVDEIQLCADLERGHVFTDRLLNARGLHETLLLGSDTMRGAIADLVPGVQFHRRERFSALAYAGSKKLSRMPARSAIVSFSVDNLYAIAELIRRQRGGCAVVMGALSPRTRNAQVDLYQNGEVDFLVATDAIGMGLNLDVRHVAFSGLRKFDGRRMRDLMPHELAQIAGRAGRYKTDGSFGVTGEAPKIEDPVVDAITNHRFAPIRKLMWRNPRLNFASVPHLVASLEESIEDEWLVKGREADDLAALRAIGEDPEIAPRIGGPKDVQLLWDVCRIPDFRGISPGEHARLLTRIFAHLHDGGRVPDDWLARQVRAIDRTDGEIDTLSKRLAYIRTWTYVAQRNGWVTDESHWRGTTRAVEDRLSDALHGALTKRFVDRRTSVLLRRLKQKESLVAEVNDKGEVTVEGQMLGRLQGFRFQQDKASSPDEAKTLRAAALAALTPQFSLRSDRFYNAPDTEIDYTEQGGLMWGEHAVGKLVKGSDPLKPTVQPFVDDEAGPDVAEKVARRLQHFIDRKIAALFEPLLALQADEALAGLARGFAFRMVEGFGIVPREGVADDVKSLDQDMRGALRKHGVRFGQFTVFLPALLKPAPTRLRLVLWGLYKGLDEFPESPPPGLVTIPTPVDAPEGYDSMAGYRVAGARAIRIDMLERLADQIRGEDTRSGFEAKADMLSITGTTLEQFAALMTGLGYKAERGERPKLRAPKAGEAAAAPEAEAQLPQPEASDLSEGPQAATDEVPAEGNAPDLPEMAEAPQPGEAAVAAPEAEAPDDTVETSADTAETDATQTEATEIPAEAAGEAAEMEVFYTFTWAPRRPGNRQGNRRGRDGAQQGAGERQGATERQGGKPQGKPGGRPQGKGKPRREGGGAPGGAGKAKFYEARPPKKEKKIDPDNPFAAALMGLKDRK